AGYLRGRPGRGQNSGSMPVDTIGFGHDVGAVNGDVLRVAPQDIETKNRIPYLDVGNLGTHLGHQAGEFVAQYLGEADRYSRWGPTGSDGRVGRLYARAYHLDHHFARLGDGAVQATDVEFFGRPEVLNRGSSHVRIEPADDACRVGRADVVDSVGM